MKIGWLKQAGLKKTWLKKAGWLKKTDWLKELEAVLVFGVVLLGLLTVSAVVGALGNSLQVTVPAEAVSATVQTGLRDGAVVLPAQDVIVEVSGPSGSQRAIWLLSTLPTHLVVVAVMVLLLRIVRAARRTDTFTTATARRLRVLAVVTLVGGYLAVIVQMLASMELSSTVMTDAIAGYSEVPTYWFLIGFGLFAAAEVVKRGCALRTELETVI